MSTNTIVDSAQWEFGSEFHWFPIPDSTAPSSFPWDARACYCASGRDAFRLLMRHGLETQGWRRLWLPSYFCQEVVQSLADTGITIVVYPDNPMQDFDPDVVEWEYGDAMLVMNYFGLRSQPSFFGIDRQQVAIIEDHSHDTNSHWAWSSEADWCVASLRKTYPLPDGGVLWSPMRHAMPKEMPVTPAHECLSLKRFSAMVLKGLYLAGKYADKDYFRRLLSASEQELGKGDLSGMPEWTRAFLRVCPVEAWRDRRMCNHRALSQALADVSRIEVVQPDPLPGMCPFSALLLFHSEDCQLYVGQRLIEQRIYPARLWSLDNPAVAGIPEHDRSLSRRLLSIPCDMRYDEQTMRHVAARISQLVAQFYDRSLPNNQKAA